jgi:hypothetical protein
VGWSTSRRSYSGAEADVYCLEKRDFFRKGGELVGQNRVTFAFFREQADQSLMAEAGFRFTSVDPDQQFVIYTWG